MRFKFVPFDLMEIEAFRAVVERLKAKNAVKKNELLLKVYEKYPDNDGDVGIDLYEADNVELFEQLEAFYKSSLSAELCADVEALKKLLSSDEWGVFLKYALRVDFNISECLTYTEKAAFTYAKESAVNTVLSVPQGIIDFYNKGVNRNGND